MKTIHLVSVAALVSLVFVAILSACGPAASPGGGTCGNQPNMANALGELRAARAELDAAEHDKGGWRGAAIQQTNDAIRETERGCQFANNH